MEEGHDVVHHRLHRLRLHGGSSHCVHDAGAIASVAVGIRMELGVPDPVSDLDTPAVAHQPEQGLWRSAQAGGEAGVWRERGCRNGTLWP
jgi:hypothetical protein